MPDLADHPLRYEVANELHARPFPVLAAPGQAAYLALKPASGAAGRDREADRAHLIALLDRHGAPHPQPGATHYFGEIGKYRLKWECHTEFVTYTVFGEGLTERPFDASTFAALPADWLAAAPGTRLTSALIRVEELTDESVIPARAQEWFVPESLAISRVLDDSLVVAGDFRIDAAGNTRFAIFARPQTGARRLGRVVQRLCEIETYKAMSMLGLFRARALGPAMKDLDDRLSALVAAMATDTEDAEAILPQLLTISAELEKLVTDNSFRFGATGAYETIVNQRIEVLRETRFEGLQTFGEFMLRRFDPAMRTVKSTERRLQTMADRAMRAGELLRTRVDVERSAQNQALLESMDRRADLQLRLQRTVEGLSVVAISYYAVNLVLYLLGPLEAAAGVGKVTLAALATPVVVALVWFMVNRIRRKME